MPEASERSQPPSRRSLAGLDWLNFFIADVQTGFGPFVAVYLTSRAWTQVEIGLVLTAGGIVGLAGQIPGGAIIDAARDKRRLAALAVGGVGLSALAIALWPVFLVVLAAKVLHSAASCLIGPAIAAISLGLVGHDSLGERLGRNARFASIGAGVAAALMGAIGYLVSHQAVFLATAAFIVPTLLALARIRAAEIDTRRASGGAAGAPRGSRLRALAEDRRLLVFAACLLLFHLANAAMLPLMAGIVTMQVADWASVLIAACMVVPQIVVAILSPWVGRQAELRGRRPLLLLGFGALALRGVLFALSADPYVLVAVQVLDGVSAATLGVLLPLIAADLTRGAGGFNVTLGILGTAMGIGASLSTTLAGYLADAFGTEVAFLGLASIVAAGLLVVWGLMPETRGRKGGG